MAGRYYLPQLSECPEIKGGEFHHLTHVLRAKVGDQIIVFDGAGKQADAEIVKISKHHLVLRVQHVHEESTSPRPSLVLATSVPKVDRFRWLVEKATELGVDRLVPLRTARSVVEPGAMKLEKMRQAVIEACKQSGRNRLMEIAAPIGWPAAVELLIPSGNCYLADSAGTPLGQAAQKNLGNRDLVLVVGPEGGLTDTERQEAIEAGAIAVSLGPRILRIETACLALAAVFALQQPTDAGSMAIDGNR